MELPKEILVYVCDFDDNGNPIFGVALNTDEIPINYNGDKVGNYTLNRVATFRVNYELK